MRLTHDPIPQGDDPTPAGEAPEPSPDTAPERHGCARFNAAEGAESRRVFREIWGDARPTTRADVRPLVDFVGHTLGMPDGDSGDLMSLTELTSGWSYAQRLSGATLAMTLTMVAGETANCYASNALDLDLPMVAAALKIMESPPESSAITTDLLYALLGRAPRIELSLMGLWVTYCARKVHYTAEEWLADMLPAL